MSLQFLRQATVTVAPKAGGKGRVIKGLRVVFSIEKSEKPCPNNAHIQIYNLAPETRAEFDKKNSQVTLEVGYGSDSQIIFIGDLRKVSHPKNGPDVVTAIETGDGETAYTTSKINKSYPAGASVGTVLKDVAGSFLGLKNTSSPLSLTGVVTAGKNLVNGLVVAGSSKDAMNDLTKKLGLDWSIQDNELQVVKAGSPTPQTAVLLTANTGLIDSPTKIVAEVDKGKQDGVAFHCLLNPTLRPGRAVAIQSASINGQFRVTKVIHSGDTHQGKWLSEVEAATI